MQEMPLSLTVDERIADGYCYAQSVRLFKYLLEHSLEKVACSQMTGYFA